MTQKKIKILVLIAVGIVIAAIIGTLLYFFTSRATYVRIVDTTEFATEDSDPFPGVDVNAVEIVKKKSGKLFYADAVVSSMLKDGAEGNENQAADAQSILGDPQQDQDSRSVSLGGGEIVVKFNTALQSGDELTVYEIGSTFGKRKESFEVHTSTSSNGPWKLVGTGAGPTTITIE